MSELRDYMGDREYRERESFHGFKNNAIKGKQGKEEKLRRSDTQNILQQYYKKLLQKPQKFTIINFASCALISTGCGIILLYDPFLNFFVDYCSFC